MKTRKINYKNIFFLLFGLICLVILIYSLLHIINWNKSNKKTGKIKKEINESVSVDENEKFEIDWPKIKEKNEDAIAYIKVNDTKIDYIVVKNSDNEYYLTHSFDKTYSEAGWPFINFQNNIDGNDKNISIFGHARLDGSMFGTLKSTLKSDWQNNKENHIIKFITEAGENEYQVFSTYRIEVEDYYIQADFATDDEFLKFITTMKDRSNFDYGVEVSQDDQVLTLSTCDIDNNYRIVLHAKKIK